MLVPASKIELNELCRLIWCALIGFFRSRASLEAEILVLRHQLNVLRRKSAKRPTFGTIDRLIFAGLHSLAPKVLSALAIVRPETVIRWHRAGFRLYWRWKSKSPGGRPKLAVDIRALIRDTAWPIRFGAHRASTASYSSSVSLSARRPWQNTWRGEGGHRHRAGRRFFAIIPMPSRRLTCSSSRRFRFDCCMDL
jgi:hypothetical protein